MAVVRNHATAPGHVTPLGSNQPHLSAFFRRDVNRIDERANLDWAAPTYLLITQVSGGTGGSTDVRVGGSADASHTLYVVVEPASSGASYVSASGVDYTRAPGDSGTSFRYQFTGFGAPIAMGVTNLVSAGRIIPLIWRLTDLTGVPVNSPESFLDVFSFQAACDAGGGADPVPGSSPGSSPLQSLGNGYWQFNWKTDKSYAGTCRRVFVKLGGGQIADQVKFSLN